MTTAPYSPFEAFPQTRRNLCRFFVFRTLSPFGTLLGADIGAFRQPPTLIDIVTTLAFLARAVLMIA